MKFTYIKNNKLNLNFKKNFNYSFLIRTGNKNSKKKKRTTYPPRTKSLLFMNHTAYLTPQEFMFQNSCQSVKPYNLEVGEHRDIESYNYYLMCNT